MIIEKYIRECYTLAKKSVENGNHPFGALLVYDNQTILTAENTIFTGNDKTRHAEMNLVSQAQRKFDSKILSECILFTSTEPCIMCCGAIYWADITKIIYGCSARALEKVAGKTIDINSKFVFSRTVNSIDVEGPVLEAEGEIIHESYW